MNRLQRYIPGFNQVIGRGPRPALARFQKHAEKAARSSLTELTGLFGEEVPSALLEPTDRRAHSRQQTYSLRNTVWAFISQALTPDVSCREVVRRIQSFCSERGLPVPSGSDSAYCQARGKLPTPRLQQIHEAVSERLQGLAQQSWLWRGRTVRVVDGTGLKLPDTAAHQAVYPQPSNQRPGCGFPVMQVVACFCLHSGALMHWMSTSLSVGESPLLRPLLALLKPTEVVLADRGFASWSNLALCHKLGIDAVMRLNATRKIDFRQGRRLGKYDRVVTWKRPECRQKSWAPEQWEQLPRILQVRVVRVAVHQKGFRSHCVDVVTTLLDARTYRKEDLAELYRRRWQAELYFRDLKTTMGIEALRCQTPAMARKELIVSFIAYNLIRVLIAKAAILSHCPADRISFKAAADSLRQYAPALRSCLGQPRKTRHVVSDMLDVIAGATVGQRPDRTEPRAVKQRPKPYQRMTRPRSQMRVSSSRRYQSKKTRKVA